jgi:hypothetical protein
MLSPAVLFLFCSSSASLRPHLRPLCRARLAPRPGAGANRLMMVTGALVRIASSFVGHDLAVLVGVWLRRCSAPSSALLLVLWGWRMVR